MKMASGSSTVVENLTHGHKFGYLNTATAFTGGNKKEKSDRSKWQTAVAQWLNI